MTTLRAVDLIARVAGVPLRHVVKVLLAAELIVDYCDEVDMGPEFSKEYDPSPPTEEQKRNAFEEYTDLKVFLEDCSMDDRLEEIRKL